MNVEMMQRTTTFVAAADGKQLQRYWRGLAEYNGTLNCQVRGCMNAVMYINEICLSALS